MCKFTSETELTGQKIGIPIYIITFVPLDHNPQKGFRAQESSIQRIKVWVKVGRKRVSDLTFG